MLIYLYYNMNLIHVWKIFVTINNLEKSISSKQYVRINLCGKLIIDLNEFKSMKMFLDFIKTLNFDNI